MADDGSDDELSRYFGRLHLPMPEPVARPAAPVPVRRAAPRAVLFEAPPVHAPRFAPAGPRRQGTKRKYGRMLSGNGKWKNELNKALKFFTATQRGLMAMNIGQVSYLADRAAEEMAKAPRSSLFGENERKQQILDNFIRQSRELTGRVYNPKGAAKPEMCEKCGCYK
jgi:hypothetical protein